MGGWQKTGLSLALAALSAAMLGGCGRRGAPELPPSAFIQNDKGQQVKKPQADKPFVLDRLIQ